MATLLLKIEDISSEHIGMLYDHANKHEMSIDMVVKDMINEWLDVRYGDRPVVMKRPEPA